MSNIADGELGAAEDKMDDNVNHPKHYTWLPNGIEVIDITENFNFCMGNALKYIMRADHKGNPIQDLAGPLQLLRNQRDPPQGNHFARDLDPITANRDSLLQSGCSIHRQDVADALGHLVAPALSRVSIIDMIDIALVAVEVECQKLGMVDLAQRLLEIAGKISRIEPIITGQDSGM